ncbi:hypothetical protein CONCODRAFT_7341 [Conidiobolus coronatus NRRL 28638]|uniref:Uncharacterized protein n=1 Tax=Conidiobolus coronatus (strain ATCC 28846 / CBS 209.66 / NRRL 28638) TaxID=796925 RepID=A0A137P522_CONC2|nr:hypothetical protein CONCODRAFT_7341 [Conidiobolus coronatus NRRL 28638]|eukprot:KXN70105.1 hypothetical protein CONCODRAFT_7341 [Conidiobolus coronatus NRRL 28638]
MDNPNFKFILNRALIGAQEAHVTSLVDEFLRLADKDTAHGYVVDHQLMITYPEIVIVNGHQRMKGFADIAVTVMINNIPLLVIECKSDDQPATRRWGIEQVSGYAMSGDFPYAMLATNTRVTMFRRVTVDEIPMLERTHDFYIRNQAEEISPFEFIFPNHLTNRIRFPHVASEETYREIYKLYPQLETGVAKACVIGGYRGLYDEINIHLERPNGYSRDITDLMVGMENTRLMVNDVIYKTSFDDSTHDPEDFGDDNKSIILDFLTSGISATVNFVTPKFNPKLQLNSRCALLPIKASLVRLTTVGYTEDFLLKGLSLGPLYLEVNNPQNCLKESLKTKSFLHYNTLKEIISNDEKHGGNVELKRNALLLPAEWYNVYCLYVTFITTGADWQLLMYNPSFQLSTKMVFTTSDMEDDKEEWIHFDQGEMLTEYKNHHNLLDSSPFLFSLILPTVACNFRVLRKNGHGTIKPIIVAGDGRSFWGNNSEGR